VKQRIAVLALFSFFVSVAAAPLVCGAWPLWPQEGVPAGTVGPTPVPAAEGGPAVNIEAIEIEAVIIEEEIPSSAEAVADASQAGETGGEKVAAGFFAGNKGKWAAFGAAVVAVAVIAAGGGSTTTHH
jgi:hypothetical protein